MMRTRTLLATSLLALAIVQTSAQAGTPAPGTGAAGRAVADVMAEPPFVESEGQFRGWILEKSQDFGVVLIEVLGTIPLHMHPDGNRRMFLIEGEMRMLGGEHDMEMKPGDYMYLPRNHRHKVWLAPKAKRALFVLVDNPPVNTSNVIWLEPTPALKKHPEQAKNALVVADRYEGRP